MSQVLWITIDDVGIEFLRGPYGEGPPETAVDLPAIESLAARGMTLKNSYVNPSCTPTRASALTGRTARDVGLGDFLTGASSEYLATTWMTVPKLAGSAVRSFHVGKWHLGARAGAMDPIGHGFGLHVGTQGNLESYMNWTWRYSFPGFYQEQQRTSYAEDELEADALALLNVITDPTWFLWLALHLPHKPKHYPPGASGDGSQLDMYKKMLRRADDLIGRVHACLASDVFILLWSDNGSPADVATTSGSKGQVREGGINVPLIVAGPGIPAGSSSDGLVCASDLCATTVDLLWGRALDNPTSPGERAPASASMLRVLAGSASSPRARTYSERFREEDGVDLRASRGERYKLVRTVGAVGDPDGERMHDLLTAAPGEDGPNILAGPLPPEAEVELPRLRAVLDSAGATEVWA